MKNRKKIIFATVAVFVLVLSVFPHIKDKDGFLFKKQRLESRIVYDYTEVRNTEAEKKIVIPDSVNNQVEERIKHEVIPKDTVLLKKPNLAIAANNIKKLILTLKRY